MARNFVLAPNEFYHLYNRGVEKRNIFLARVDRDRFVALLYLANQTEPADLKYQGRSFNEITEARTGDPLVEVVAYCLMPNHFHLMVRELVDGGVAKFMQKLTTGYTMYFNKRNQRNGALFQGTYRAVHVDNDRYFRYLVSYIHLNPIKLINPQWKENGISDREAAERYLSTYEYSSYLDYCGAERKVSGVLTKSILMELYPAAREFETSVTEWLSYSSDFDKV